MEYDTCVHVYVHDMHVHVCMCVYCACMCVYEWVGGLGVWWVVSIAWICRMGMRWVCECVGWGGCVMLVCGWVWVCGVDWSNKCRIGVIDHDVARLTTVEPETSCSLFPTCPL